MKKILIFVLAVVMVLSLCGCGASVDTAKLDEILSTIKSIQTTLDSMSAAAPAEEAAAPAAEAPAEEAPAEEAPALEGADLSEIPDGAETLKIGLMIHTTGWFAGVDSANFNEFNAMVDYINQNGGWEVGGNTYYLEPIFADGQSDNAALRTAAMSLVDAGVKFVVETNDFWVINSTDVFEDEGVLHASAYCVSNNIPYLVNPLAFTGSDGSVGDLQACFEVFSTYYPDVKTVAYANDDNGSNDETYELLKTIAAPYGIEMVGNIVYPGDTTDYSSYAQQLVDTGADAFVGNGSPDAYGQLLKAVRALGDDMVMGCAQGKPISMVMEYAGADASYNGFTLGPSTRASDKTQNTDLLNALVEVVRAKYGDEAAGTFDGAAANTLYTILQMMQRAGSVDPEAVAAAWEEGGAIDSLYGPATICGTETYGVANHAVGTPKAVSMMNPDAEDGWEFMGWIEVEIP